MKLVLIFTYLLSFCFSYLRKVPSWFYYLFVVVLALIAGLRDVTLFNDYDNYIKAFEEGGSEKYEPSFIFIVYITKLVTSTPFLMFFIYALLGVFIKAFAIKRLTQLYFLSLAIYISYFYILHEMTQIRAGIASGILLLCIKPLLDKTFLKFLLLSFLAIFFHYSAIIIIPLYFIINNKSINQYFWMALIPLSYFIHFAGITISQIIPMIPIDFVQTLWKLYEFRMSADIGMDINIFNVTQLLRCGIAFFLLYYSSIIGNNNKYFIVLIKIYVLGIISFVLFADVPDFAFRISQFYLVVEIILIPFIVYVFKQKKIAYVFPMLVGLIFLYLNLFYAKLIS